MGRYNLLCNSCNWEFVGFAIPGTVPTGNRKRAKAAPQDTKLTPLAFETEPKKVAENAQLSETITSIESTTAETAEESNADFEADEGKNSLIDNVLIKEVEEIKPKELKPRIRRKRRVKVKSAAK